MKYNTLGKTGLKVSALGLGGHEFDWSFRGHVKESHMMDFDPDRAAESDAAACRASVAWQVQRAEVHTSALAIDSPAQMEQNLSAMAAEPDEALLQSYIPRGRDLLALLDRVDELPPYRRERVITACKTGLGVDLGDGPAEYRQHLLEARAT